MYVVALGARVEPHDYALLSSEERDRAASYRFERDRARFVGLRAALRRRLGEALGRDPASLRIGAVRDEKPRLDGGPGFGVSRSGDVGLIAIADGPLALGVDVERVEGALDPALAARVLVAAEQAELMALPAEARLPAFLRAWTRKEALLKASGDGLSIAPETVDARQAPPGWTLRELAAPGWVGALAAETTPLAVHVVDGAGRVLS